MNNIIKHSEEIRQFGLSGYYRSDDGDYYIEKSHITRNIPRHLTADIMFYDDEINEDTPIKEVHYIKNLDDYIKDLKLDGSDIPCISNNEEIITLPVDIWYEVDRTDSDLGHKITYGLIPPIKWFHHLINYGRQVTADEFRKIIVGCVEQSLNRNHHYYSSVFIMHKQESDEYQIVHLHDTDHDVYFGKDEWLLSRYGSAIDIYKVADFIAEMRDGRVLLYKIYDHYN